MSNTAKIKSGGGTKLKLIVLAANPSRIRSNASGEMTDVPAAAERNSRSAVLRQFSLERSAQRWLSWAGPETGSSTSPLCILIKF